MNGVYTFAEVAGFFPVADCTRMRGVLAFAEIVDFTSSTCMRPVRLSLVEGPSGIGSRVVSLSATVVASSPFSPVAAHSVGCRCSIFAAL